MTADGVAKILTAAAGLVMALGGIGLRCDSQAPAGERSLHALYEEREAGVDDEPEWLGYPQE